MRALARRETNLTLRSPISPKMAMFVTSRPRRATSRPPFFGSSKILLAGQCISQPPSTLKAAPVIFSARSEARKAAISPMSFGV